MDNGAGGRADLTLRSLLSPLSGVTLFSGVALFTRFPLGALVALGPLFSLLSVAGHQRSVAQKTNQE